MKHKTIPFFILLAIVFGTYLMKSNTRQGKNEVEIVEPTEENVHNLDYCLDVNAQNKIQ